MMTTWHAILRPLRRLSLGVISVGVSLGGSLGCANDPTTGPIIPLAQQYWQLTLNHHAITLALTAPYDTLQLVATPRNPTGAPLADSGTTTFTSSDSSSVQVTATGVLIAKKPEAGVTITASRTIGNLTLRDSAAVNVNNVSTIPRVMTLTLQPSQGDSLNHSISDTFWLTYQFQLYATVLDANGDSIPNVAVAITVPDTTVLNYKSKLNITLVHQPGHTMAYAEATVYGVTRTDSAQIIIGWPLSSTVSVYPLTPKGHTTPIGYFDPGDITVGTGAIVAWENWLTGQPIDVVFDNPAQAMSVDSAAFIFPNFQNNIDLTYHPTTCIGCLSTPQLIIPQEGGGNIPAFVQDSVCIGDTFSDADGYECENGQPYWIGHARQFPTVGTYPYHSALYGTTGVITVLPETQVP